MERGDVRAVAEQTLHNMMSFDIRKTVVMTETIRHDGGAPPAQPLRLAVAAAVMANPFAGRTDADYACREREGRRAIARLGSGARVRSDHRGIWGGSNLRAMVRGRCAEAWDLGRRAAGRRADRVSRPTESFHRAAGRLRRVRHGNEPAVVERDAG